MRLSGAKTKKETVNLALREYVAAERRGVALDRYMVGAKGWDYEGWERLRAKDNDPDRKRGHADEGSAA